MLIYLSDFFSILYVHKWFQQNNWVYLTRIGAVACLEDKQATDNSLESNGGGEWTKSLNAWKRNGMEQTCPRHVRMEER